MRILAVAAAYFVTAKLGLMFAIPPGYATPIFLASGAALVTLLTWGNRMVAGVFLGSMVANFIGDRSVPIAVVIGAGASLQALAGAWLVRRTSSFPNAMTEPSGVLRFLLLGGPVSCLVNASWSVTALSLSGKVPPESLLYTWATWWAGDSIGVMVMAPMALIFLAEPRAHWSRRRLTVALPMGVVFTAMVGLFLLTGRNEQAKIEARLHEMADDVQRSIQKRLDVGQEVLHAIAGLNASSTHVDRAEFRTFVGRYLARNPELQALSFNPRIAAADREAHEAATRGEGFAGYAISERDAAGRLVPAAVRPEYFPIYYIEPTAGNEPALGFDIHSNPARRDAMERARATGAIAASGPMDLVQAPGKMGILLAAPLKSDYASAVFNVERLVMSALVGVRRDGVRFSIHDGTSLYSEPEGGEAALTWTRTLPVGGRTWELRFWTPHQYLTSHPAWEAWTVLAGGMVFTSLLGAFLLVVTGRSIAIEGIVATRTAELRGSEGRFRALAETANDAIITANAAGEIVQWNRAAQRLFGYPESEVVGKPLTVLMPERFREAHVQGLNRVRAGGEQRVIGRTVELAAVRRDGTEFPCELSIATWESGSDRFFTGFMRDITERHRLEQDLRHARERAEEASRAKSDFLANMSHEIRTPMNGIIGMTELALATDLTPTQKEYLGMVRSSADNLIFVINDILDFSKIEARKMTLEETDFDLREVLETAAKTVAVRAHEKRLELACLVPSALPPRLVGDPARLRQIVLNLLSNAVKFTDRGDVVLTAALESAAGPILRFSVRDTGPGIPSDKLEAIFQPFVQADSSTTRQFGGTGLGLAICRQLVELMGGRLWVESRPGEGSTFHFTARFKPASGPAPVDPRIEDLRGVTVAAADDNEVNRIVLRETLTGWNLQPSVFSRGAELIAALEAAADQGEPFELIILDDRMPEMPGLEVAEEIRRRPKLAVTPIIFLGSSLEAAESLRRRQLGIAAALFKPVRSTDLLKAVLNALGKSSRSHASSHLQPAVKTRGLRILVAEDHPINQRLTLDVLHRGGHEVTLVADGRAAVEAAGRSRFDVVLMDIQMPVFDGLAATKEIRRVVAHRPPHLPIIALTAHALKSDRDRCLAAGMDGYISKPIRVDELTSSIEAVLAGGPAPAAKEAAPPPASAALSFDPVIALRQVGDDPKMLREILGDFLKEAPGQVAAMRRSLDASDWEVLERTAHTLKGTCVLLGAESTRKEAHAVEMGGRSKDGAGAAAPLQRLAKEAERLCADVARHLSITTPR